MERLQRTRHFGVPLVGGGGPSENCLFDARLTPGKREAGGRRQRHWPLAKVDWRRGRHTSPKNSWADVLRLRDIPRPDDLRAFPLQCWSGPHRDCRQGHQVGGARSSRIVR
jgi:hypothetical protein